MDAIRRGNLHRQSAWTEGVAVGSEEFVRQVEETLRVQGRRVETVVEKADDGAWLLRETPLAYG